VQIDKAGDARGQLDALGAEPGGQSPADFAKLIDSDVRKWAKVVKDSGAKID